MRRAIAAVGRTLVTIGLLILLFVVYQLWGTNILEARAQDKLEDDFRELTESVTPTTVAPTPETAPIVDPVPTTTTTLASLPTFAEKDAIGRIEIPKIGVDKIFVQGTAIEDLKLGPGHYGYSPMPGQLGNAAIAGHRTTYGAPFNRLDELQPGDEIIITMPNGGRYVYKMREQLIVAPTDTSVVTTTDFTKAELTLTTCNPKYSARQRLIVHADLSIDQSPPPVAFDPSTLDDAPVELPGGDRNVLQSGLRLHANALGPAYFWGSVVAVIGLAWWWIFRRWRHPGTWLVGVLPFLGFLFVFYVFLERALPPGT